MNPPKVTNAHSKVQMRVYFSIMLCPASVIKWNNVDDKQSQLSALRGPTPGPSSVEARLQLVFTQDIILRCI